MLNCIIDISHHQVLENYDALVEDGIIGIIHKASQGNGMVDNRYALRKGLWKDGRKLLWGSYHFLSASKDGTVQAQHFLDVVGDYKNELLVLDWELDNGLLPAIKTVSSFIDEITKQTGKLPILYYNQSVHNEHGSQFINFDIWIARYGKQPNFNTWKLWQYTESGKVNGISGNVDRNYFNGIQEELIKFWGIEPELATALNGVNVKTEELPDNYSIDAEGNLI